MSDSKRLIRPWIVGVIVMLPLLYALSIGPAVWLATRGMMSPAVLVVSDSFYRPLGWVIQHSPKPIQNAWVVYDSLWRKKPTGPRPGAAF
jgi:hypothetical protein